MELKHVCKFCKKSFPCGRSLGGHIRSHLIHNNQNNKNSGDAPKEEPELPKSGSGPGYELRENPKKTNKAADLLNSSPSSWSTESETEFGSNPSKQQRSLSRRSSFIIGGNNSHSSASEVVEPEQEEVAIAMCLIMLSRDVGNWGDDYSSVAAEFSDDILLLQANNTKKRTRREKIQGKQKLSVSGCNNINKKNKKLEFGASGYLPNGSKMEEFDVSGDGLVSNDQSKNLSESKNSVSDAVNSKKVESAASGHLQNGLKMKGLDNSGSGFNSNDQNNKTPQSKRKIGDPTIKKNKKKMETAAFGHVRNGLKLKEPEVSEDGSALNDQKSNNYDLGFDVNGMSSEFYDNSKRSKFECTTCNKVFHSYQALGGHRASHKKLLGIKNSLASKLEASNKEDHHQQQPEQQQQQQLQEQEQAVAGAQIEIGSSSSKKVIQKHECPICFRVFPSGQALGGHKRSHLLAVNSNNNNNNQSSVLEISPSPETRDFLDLNFPPATAEEENATIPTASSSNSLVGLIKPYWWVESSNHEPFLGLISN